MNTTCDNLQQVLTSDMNRMINAELQIKKVLADWVAFASIFSLKTGLHQYGHNIDERLKKLRMFAVEQKNEPAICDEIMAAHIKVIREKLSSCRGTVCDACLIARIQSVIHYKISLYGTLSSFANLLAQPDLGLLFQDSLRQEKKMDDFLTYLARMEVNRKAINL